MPAVINGTDGITFPTWTTPTRPASPAVGQVGYNTTIGAMETYNGTTWSTSDLPATGASGNFLQSTGTAWTSASTLAVSNGGTGQTTLTTAYGVLAAGTTATGALQNIGTGTSTQVLTSNGPGVLPSFQAAAAGGFSNMTVYASPGTFTTPSTTTRIKVTVVGGGGGGAGGSGANAGTGGGGGGTAIYVGPVTASTPYAVTVGTGGTGGIAATPGVAGGTSSFGPLASATGGTAGAAGGAPSSNPGVAGGAGSAGTLLFTGSRGGPNFTATSLGGPSFLGAGGGATNTNGGAASAGTNYGGGGGGAGGGSGGSPAIAAAGAGGVVIVEF